MRPWNGMKDYNRIEMMLVKHARDTNSIPDHAWIGHDLFDQLVKESHIVGDGDRYRFQTPRYSGFQSILVQRSTKYGRSILVTFTATHLGNGNNRISHMKQFDLDIVTVRIRDDGSKWDEWGFDQNNVTFRVEAQMTLSIPRPESFVKMKP